MGLNYRNLDERTRTLMLEEIERDIAANALFLSENLSPQGQIDYPDLLRAAARAGDDVTLGAGIQSRLNSHEKPKKLEGGRLSKPSVMRSNAHEMLGQGEFNRFYIRAVCVRAVADGVASVIVYRGRESKNPRPESEAMVGQAIAPAALLDDLRHSQGRDPTLLPCVNSGLTVHLP